MEVQDNSFFKVPLPELKEKAYKVRRHLVDLIYSAGSGHLDTSLSLVEIWLGLTYSKFFHLDAHDGAWDGRDRIFLSEGHACPVQYVINAELGYYPYEELVSGFRHPKTPFQGHTDRSLAHGFENSNGSLSIGMWQAYGHALELDQQVFCIAGDGEFQEPASIGLLAAPHNLKPLGNFTLIVNNNRLAQDSMVDIGAIVDVATAYGWQTLSVNGHDLSALGEAYVQAVENTTQPTFLLCNTVKGYGGDPLRADKLGSHGVPPKDEKELREYKNGVENWWRNA